MWWLGMNWTWMEAWCGLKLWRSLAQMFTVLALTRVLCFPELISHFGEMGILFENVMQCSLRFHQRHEPSSSALRNRTLFVTPYCMMNSSQFPFTKIFLGLSDSNQEWVLCRFDGQSRCSVTSNLDYDHKILCSNPGVMDFPERQVAPCWAVFLSGRHAYQ